MPDGKVKHLKVDNFIFFIIFDDKKLRVEKELLLIRINNYFRIIRSGPYPKR